MPKFKDYSEAQPKIKFVIQRIQHIDQLISGT